MARDNALDKRCPSRSLALSRDLIIWSEALWPTRFRVRQRATITCSFGPWRDMVIPVAMECLLLDTDLCQLLITHLDSDGIAGSVQLRLDGQAGLGGGVGNPDSRSLHGSPTVGPASSRHC